MLLVNKQKWVNVVSFFPHPFGHSSILTIILNEFQFYPLLQIYNSDLDFSFRDVADWR